MFGKNKVAVVVAEFFGTAVLAMAVLSMSIYKTLPYFPAGAAGFTLALMVLVIGPISGSHINPAITLGQWTLRKVTTLTALVYIVAQMLGGLVAWRLGSYMLNTELKVTASSQIDWHVFVAEVVGTFIFSFAVATAVKRGYEGVQSAVVQGAGLFIGILAASLGSAGLLNPALALPTQNWNASYLLAPIVGSILGMTVYVLMSEPVQSVKKSTAKARK